METKKKKIDCADRPTKAMLVQNGKPRYKSSIVRGFELTGAKLVAGKIAKTLINVSRWTFRANMQKYMV